MLGVRNEGQAAAGTGFLILGGPVGDGNTTYHMYFWNGEDCIPGSGSPGGKVIDLGELPALGGKPEGIAVAEHLSDRWRVIVLCDGSDKATTFLVPRQ